MAKLGSYYGLCPLIDQKSLLGVSEDATPGCVIVTLGGNMAIKYKLSDQKQIHSWSTKIKMTSPVVYDKHENRYVAAFAQNFIRVWNDGENHLEKLPKIKFSVSIHTIIPTEDEPIVVFKNGHVLTLSQALENRKNIPQIEIFKKDTTIEDQTCLKIDDKYYVGMLLKCNDSGIPVYAYSWVSMDTQTHKAVDLKRRELVNLNGHLVTLTDSEPVLYTLWSDGRLFSYPLTTEKELLVESPGNFYADIEFLSRQQPISMVTLNTNYIAMFGADSNDEGASLHIYNTQFKVSQCRQQFKLFTEGAKLWIIGNSLILPVGRNLAVVPFHLATEQLAALVGSHKLISTVENQDISIVVTTANWDETSENEKMENGFDNDEIPTILLKTEIFKLVKEGWSEFAICEHLFPKLIEKKDFDGILSGLYYFSDIPETVIVKLLQYFLSSAKTSKNFNLDVMKTGLPNKYGKVIDKLLTVSYSDVLLLPHLRTDLKFDEVLLLLQYLCFLLSENGHSLASISAIDLEAKIIDWGSLLLDAHYQELLLSRDAKIIECLEYFKALVDAYMLCMEEDKKVEPVLIQLKKGRNNSKVVNMASMKYSIEQLKLY